MSSPTDQRGVGWVINCKFLYLMFGQQGAPPVRRLAKCVGQPFLTLPDGYESWRGEKSVTGFL